MRRVNHRGEPPLVTFVLSNDSLKGVALILLESIGSRNALRLQPRAAGHFVTSISARFEESLKGIVIVGTADLHGLPALS